MSHEDTDWRKYYDCDFKEGTFFDAFGVAHEPGSEAAQHMTHMHHSGAKFDSIEQFEAYPWPVWDDENISHISSMVKKSHENDIFVLGPAECTVWEVSWYFRDMTVLMTSNTVKCDTNNKSCNCCIYLCESVYRF